MELTIPALQMIFIWCSGDTAITLFGNPSDAQAGIKRNAHDYYAVKLSRLT